MILSPERWQRVQALFLDAADRPAAERAAFLDAACRTPDGAPDDALRAEVEALLEADDTDGGLLDEDVAALLVGEGAGGDGQGDGQNTAAPEAPHPLLGARVGPYRLEAVLGVGGMGEVFRAERADGQFRQRVALKLVRGGAARGLRADARFRRERQILAGLEHEGIARLLGGGLAEGGPADGRPYLAMEFVEGEPVTAWADRHDLGVEDRLALFAQVCDAVAYAHRRLVVHRDLKPSNVLVATDADGRPRVKLLDFGIAKLLDEGEAADGDAFATRTAEPAPMTPGYAAPEQVRGEAVTTATDVYGLGALLYELLAGRRPFADTRSAYALAQAVVEHEPERASAAAARAGRPERWRRRVAGDLDAVCAKALRKAPEDRYASAEALALDVRRHLDGRPVRAREGHGLYHARLFARRHRGALAAGAAFVLLAAGFAAWDAVRVRDEREAARAAAARAETVADFLTGLFEAGAPERALGATPTALDLLAAGEARADSLRDQPDLQAALLLAIGRSYSALGEQGRAVPLLRRARALQLGRSDPLGEDAAQAHAALAAALQKQGAFAEADSAYGLALAAFQRALGPAHARTLQALSDRAGLYIMTGHYGEAERLLEHVRARQAEGGAEPLSRAATLGYLSVLAADRHDVERSLALAREAHALRAAHLPPDHPDLLVDANNLGLLEIRRGEFAAAEARFRALVPRYVRVYGAGHPSTGLATMHLALALRRSGREAEAVPLLERVVALQRAANGPDHPDTGNAEVSLGWALLGAGRAADSEAPFRRALAAYRASLGETHARTATALLGTGAALTAQGRAAEGLPLLEAGLTLRTAAHRAGSPGVGEAQLLRGEALAALGRTTDARAALAEAERLLAEAGPGYAREARRAVRALAALR